MKVKNNKLFFSVKLKVFVSEQSTLHRTVPTVP